MTHRLFNLMAALSMAMFFTVAVLWATDRVGHATWHITYESHPGMTQNNVDLTLARRGFITYETNRFMHWNYAELRVSYWAAMTVCLLLPALWLWRAMHPRARSPGLCEMCGYDLRASTDRCPECGTIITSRNIETRHRIIVNVSSG